MPEIVGRGGSPGAVAVITRSERHTPSPATTFELEAQFALVQLPPCSFWLALVHERQLEGPAAEHVAQLESQDWHWEVAALKNSFEAHVGRQRPLMSTGRLAGQLVHWLNEDPEQLEQSG